MKPIAEKDLRKLKRAGKIAAEDLPVFRPEKTKAEPAKPQASENQLIKSIQSQIGSFQNHIDTVEKLAVNAVEKLAGALKELAANSRANSASQVNVNVEAPKEWEFIVHRNHADKIERLTAIRKK